MQTDLDELWCVLMDKGEDVFGVNLWWINLWCWQGRCGWVCAVHAEGGG